MLYIFILDHCASIERNFKLKKKIDVAASTSYKCEFSNYASFTFAKKKLSPMTDGTYEIQKAIFQNVARLVNEVRSVSIEAELEKIRRLLHLIYN